MKNLSQAWSFHKSRPKPGEGGNNGIAEGSGINGILDEILNGNDPQINS